VRLFGPTIGGFIANKRDFGTSCIYVAVLNLGYCILVGGYNLKSISEYIKSNKLYIQRHTYHIS
jgi:hypothetical protein